MGQRHLAVVLPHNLLSIQHEPLLLNEERKSTVLRVNQATSIKTSNSPRNEVDDKAEYLIEGSSIFSDVFIPYSYRQ